MRELEAACERAVGAYREANPDCDDAWGEIMAGGEIPTREQVVGAYRRLRLELTADVVDRLEGCRSSLLIDRPGDIDTDRLQVSVLRYLLEGAGQGLVMFNDYPLVPTDQALTILRRKRGAPGFVTEVSAPEKRAVKTRKERPGEVRALRVLEVLRSAAADPGVAIDVRRSLERASEGARRYASLLMTEGAMDDERAAKSLGVKQAALTRDADALDALLAAEEH